jgi:hypothetical protein
MTTVKISSVFSPRRFGRLMLLDLSGSYRSALIAFAAVAGAVITVSFLTAFGVARVAAAGASGASGFHPDFFLQILFIGGFIAASLAFRDVHKSGSGILYLMLPASRFEKFAGKLLLTSVGYALVCLIGYTAIAAVSEAVNRLVLGAGNGFFNPFSPAILKAVGSFLLAQSVFLLGSIWFRKLAFVKTVLWLMIVIVGAAVVGGIVARIVLAPHFAPSSVQVSGIRIFGDSLSFGNQSLEALLGPGTRWYSGLMVFKTIAQVFLCGLLPVAFWVAGYFKLGETEV